MHMDLPSETQAFSNILKERMMPMNLDLNDLPLTKDNVPVVVDAFVNYIALNGKLYPCVLGGFKAWGLHGLW